MTHNINKQNIFDFFKGNSFVESISDNSIIIDENKPDAQLRQVVLHNLIESSQYWVVDTESNAFQLQGNKVEKIILEQTKESVLNIIMVELKSARVKENEIRAKFKNSLELVYILLHLLEGKANQAINVCGILVAQKDMQWNAKENLKIFSSTSIRYTKRSFYTQEAKIELEYKDVVAKIMDKREIK